MAASRTQVSTYFTDDQLDDWLTVKEHYGEASTDAAVLRQMVHEKAIEIRTGNTRRDSLRRIELELNELRKEQEWQRTLLMKIADRVGIEA